MAVIPIGFSAEGGQGGRWLYCHGSEVFRAGEERCRSEEGYDLGGDEWSERTIEPLMFCA